VVLILAEKELRLATVLFKNLPLATGRSWRSIQSGVKYAKRNFLATRQRVALFALEQPFLTPRPPPALGLGTPAGERCAFMSRQ
jgi:hypothetical protein